MSQTIDSNCHTVMDSEGFPEASVTMINLEHDVITSIMFRGDVFAQSMGISCEQHEVLYGYLGMKKKLVWSKSAVFKLF